MARKKHEEIEVEEANVLPVMNIMFLLIPALLLAMEVASMAAISVSPPKFSAAPSEKKEQEKKDEKQLKLKIFIMEDGFRVSAADQQEGAEAGKSADSNSPSIPLKRDDAGGSCACGSRSSACWLGARRPRGRDTVIRGSTTSCSVRVVTSRTAPRRGMCRR